MFSGKAAKSAASRGVLFIGTLREDARLRTPLEDIFSNRDAEVVEWQTRTFEGRVAKAVRVQVPPSAPNLIP